MKSITDPRVLADLRGRLGRLTPHSERRWGKMNVQQMLSHVARPMEVVLAGEGLGTWDKPPSRAIKFLALRVPLRWPKGVPNPNDPAGVDVPIDSFEPLRRRVIDGLEAMSTWQPTGATTPHPAFGPLTTWEWRRWAYLHADHHLRQFSS